MSRPKDRTARFWDKVDKSGDCWLWRGSIFRCGYGKVTFKGQTWAAHRLAFTLSRGEIPTGLCVCHRCDVRACVNPDHLFLGTNDENMADMVRKNRAARNFGERGGRARLSSEAVLEICSLRAEGLSVAEIARRIGRPYSTVQHAASGYSWSHLGDGR